RSAWRFVVSAASPLMRRIRAITSPDADAEPNPHDSRATGVLRPIVFGANDGLVSNLALVMGVAGASAEPGVIVLAGIAGLLAGAFSMGVGEYISVQSQRELLEYQVDFERRQLADTPDQEYDILVGIYMSRGLTHEEAKQFADRMFAEPDRALETLVREEVGLDPRAIGSPVSAALGSFVAFTLGAFVPVVPYLLGSGLVAFWSSLIVSLVALFLLGLGVSLFTHRHPIRSGVRQLLLGLVAAVVTYGVGLLLGAAGI
ncbi:MAG TPA: VIT1/CCC1 transporter family protein, partial [Candidatus Deferrimicrobium sp.]|nr:VIT1/CCC1 transporter family protein [Candidatus Deferrimicrobium sp.]